MASKVSPERSERGRVVIQQILEERFAGSQSQLAQTIGVSQPTISQFIAGKTALGGKVLDGIARISPDSLDYIMFGGRTTETLDRYPNRVLAIEYLIRSGRVRSEVIRAADAVGVALDANDDPNPEWWATRITETINSLRKGSTLGVRKPHEDDF